MVICPELTNDTADLSPLWPTVIDDAVLASATWGKYRFLLGLWCIAATPIRSKRRSNSELQIEFSYVTNRLVMNQPLVKLFLLSGFVFHGLVLAVALVLLLQHHIVVLAQWSLRRSMKKIMSADQIVL